jgi:hypothetical protein
MMVPAAIYGPQSWFNAGWNAATNPAHILPNAMFNYYGDYINILTMIAASGNEWTPVGSSLTIQGGATANGFSSVRRIVAGARVPLRASSASNFTRWDVQGADFWPGYGPNTPNTYIRMPLNRSVTARVVTGAGGGGTNIPANNTAVGFVYMFTQPRAGESEWDAGFNNATGPQIEFDVTVHQDVILRLPAWPGGNGRLHDELRDIYLLQPTAAASPNRLPVTLHEIRVNGVRVQGSMSHTAVTGGWGSSRWLVGGTIGTRNPVTIPAAGGFAGELNVFAPRNLQLRTFYPTANAFTIPMGAVVEIVYRVGNGPGPTVIAPQNAAVGFVYMFTQPRAGESEWDAGLNNATSPQVEFDITVHQDVVLTIPSWPGGNGRLHDELRDIYLLQPTSTAAPNRLPVTLHEIRVNGVRVQGSMSHSAVSGGWGSSRWLVGGTLGTRNPVTIPAAGGFAGELNVFAPRNLQLRTFYPAANAFTIPAGAVVEIVYRVGNGS